MTPLVLLCEAWNVGEVTGISEVIVDYKATLKMEDTCYMVKQKDLKGLNF